MKLTKIVKYFGYACGVAGAFLLFLGVLGFVLDAPIFNVKYPYNFFWAANSFIFLGIFCVLATKCCCCECETQQIQSTGTSVPVPPDPAGGDTNLSPTAVASASKETLVLPENTVLLKGDRSFEPGGGNLIFSWSQKSGPAAIIETPNAKITPVQLAGEGIYTFTLKVTDVKGTSNSTDIRIVVRNA